MEATTKGAFELVVRAETEASRNDAMEPTHGLGFWEAFRGAATVARDVIRVASTTMGDDDAPGGGRGRGRGRGARGGAARGGARGGGRRRGASTMPRDGDGDARGRGARAGGDGGGDDDGGDARGMKIVVRALPRGLTREGFERALRRDGFEFGEAYAYLDYAQGKSRSGESGSGGASASGRVGDGGATGAGRAAPLSRCYIQATSAETARAMMNKYNLAKFRVRERDSEGELVPNGAVEECVARAERAPSQWTPASYDEAKNGIRASSTTPTTNDIETEDEDAKCVVVRNALENTIHEDEDYLKFVAALEDERRGGGKGATTNGPVAPASDTRKKTTALLEFLWRKRAQEARHASAETANSAKSTKKKPKKKSKNASTSTAAADKTGPGPPNSGASKKQATSGKGGKNASKAKTPPTPKPEGSGPKIKAIRRPPPKPKQETT